MSLPSASPDTDHARRHTSRLVAALLLATVAAALGLVLLALLIQASAHPQIERLPEPTGPLQMVSAYGAPPP